jgi:predicted peptidase
VSTLLGWSLAALVSVAGEDLELTYRSAIDDTDQPYRLYVPAPYDGKTALPLIVALHGTGGTEATLFEKYGDGAIKRAAEKHGVLLVSPQGRGTTEYYGIGETDVLSVIADVQSRYRVDPDRISITGHSMGGTGAARLALQHPDLFAGAAPLAPAFSHPYLARNAGHVPHWWILGGEDEPFYLKGVLPGAERMLLQGRPHRISILPG